MPRELIRAHIQTNGPMSRETRRALVTMIRAVHHSMGRIVVDELKPTTRSRRWPFTEGCHLIHLDNDRTVLDAFATTLGMKLAWIQKAGTTRMHYDLSRARRLDAVKRGAREVTRSDADFRTWLRQGRK